MGTINIDAASGALTLGGTVVASGVTLNALGSITQPDGYINTSTLNVASSGSITLGQSLNQIGTLTNGTAPGGFALTDGTPLAITGTITSSASGQAVTITDDAPSLGPNSLISATSGTVTLQPLTSGSTFTIGGGNGIGGTPGIDALALVIGSTNAGAVQVSGQFNLGGTVGQLLLISGGPVLETGTGAIVTTTGTLGASGTTITLNGANSVPVLGAVSAANGFSFNDTTGLKLVGPIAAGGLATLNAAGTIQVAGSLAAPSVDLSATGDITELGGSITGNPSSGGTTLLASTTGGSVLLTQATNKIAALAGPASATGDFSITDSVPLTVSGLVSAGSGHTLTITDDAPTFAPSTGQLSASGGTVVLQPFTSNTNFVIAGGGGISGTPPILANTLIIGSATTGTVSIAGAFNLSSISTAGSPQRRPCAGDRLWSDCNWPSRRERLVDYAERQQQHPDPRHRDRDRQPVVQRRRRLRAGGAG